MSAAQPTIVVFAGAYHEASCMDLLLESLQTVGFSTEAHTLASTGDPSKQVSDDEDKMRYIIMQHIDRGKEIVLVLHSYAGFPGCGAIAGLDKKSLEACGKIGGILGVVYLAAFVPIEGKTIHAMLGGQWAHWHNVKEEQGVVDALDGRNVFYNDCDDELAAKAMKSLRPHSYKAFVGLTSAMGIKEPGFNGRRAYIKCLKDQALPVSAQDAFVENSGVEWQVRTMDTSHSPFLSVPAEMVKVLEELIASFKLV